MADTINADDLVPVSSATINSDDLTPVNSGPSFLPNYNSVMDSINNRPSMIASLIKDPSTLTRLQQHPLGTILRTLGGAAEYAEGIPSDVGLALQKGNLSSLPQDILSTIQGQKPAQYGDLIRTTGFGGILNNPISATIGTLASLGTNIGANRAAELTTQPAVNGLDKILNPGTPDLIKRAQDIATQILQPSKGELTDYLSQGKVLPAVEQAAKIITKSKNYGDLTQNINNSIKTIFDQRNDILKNNNFPVNTDYMKPLQDLIDDTIQRGQATPSEIQQMQDVMSREQAFHTQNVGSFDRLAAQDRKEYLQNQTQTLLKKLSTGDIIDTQPARTLSLNALRDGLKTAVEGGDQQVSALNSTYGGLLRAKELVSGQNALAQKEITPHPIPDMIQKVTGLFLKPQETALDIATSNLNNLSSRTSQIESLMNTVRKRGVNP